jgi:glycosyl hydrolase family 109/GFO/IDH/MocA oxidoreductase family protein
MSDHPPHEPSSPVNVERRRFLGATLAGAAVGALDAPAHGEERATRRAASANRSVMDLALPPMERIRIGVIGVGMRGAELLRLSMAVPGTEITALCDTHGPTLEHAVELVRKTTGKTVPTYTGRDDIYKALVARPDVDAVIIATPWQWHVPMALDSMANGKQTFVEVPAALNVEDAWQLVESAEKHRVHCMMLENCCYGRSELMLLELVRADVLGEIIHGEGAYIHDLRWILKDMNVGEGHWRPQWYTKRMGNAYPTHGLGPLAQCMGINRGDQFDSIVSMSSPARGFAAAAKSGFPADYPANKLKFILGDMNSSLIQTKSGRTLLLQHDVCSPRPYSRINLLQGLKGTFAGYPDRLALDDHGGGEEWITDLTGWFRKYDNVLWSTQLEQATAQGGHGGMDFVMIWRIVHCLRNGLPMDQSVYDAAAWSVIFDLSEQSVRARAARRDFPDFTRGVWQHTAPVKIELAAAR